MDTTYDIALVGGGIAGLVGAIEAARRGARAVVLERATEPGGRARSHTRDGFTFNQGAHALYEGGALAGALRAWKLDVPGARPRNDPAFTLWQGQMLPLPTGAWSLLSAGWLTLGERLTFARLLAGIGRLDPGAYAGRSVEEWIAGTTEAPRLRGLMRAFARVSTYGGSLQEMSAGCAIAQLASANQGVRYLDGGWQSLVDRLSLEARERGVVILGGHEVVAIEGEAPALALRTAEGAVVRARSAVVSGAPATVAALVERGPGPLQAFARSATPVHATALDVALSTPLRGVGLVLGSDEPVYLNDHQRTARLGPPGSALVHLLRYDEGKEIEPGVARQGLEGLLTRVMPGWRHSLVHERFLPRVVVHHALVRAAQGGFAGRPSPRTERPGVLVAGDWVGASGLLADASAASGLAATRLALEGAGYARRDAA